MDGWISCGSSGKKLNGFRIELATKWLGLWPSGWSKYGLNTILELTFISPKKRLLKHLDYTT